jgi:hypothetical protein
MNKKITRRKLLKENEELRANYMHAIYSIMEIRQAIGDIEGKLSHKELVEKIKSLKDINK